MKVYRVKKDGKLNKNAVWEDLPSGQSSQRVGIWNLCYKISKDGMGIVIDIDSPDGYHRGLGKAEDDIVKDLFSIKKIGGLAGGKQLNVSVVNDSGAKKTAPGFGEIPPPPSDDPSLELSEAEKARISEQPQRQRAPEVFEPPEAQVETV